MSPWDDQHVRDLVDELERHGKIPGEVAEAARAAANAGDHTEALDIALDRDASTTARERRAFARVPSVVGGRDAPTPESENEDRDAPVGCADDA